MNAEDEAYSAVIRAWSAENPPAVGAHENVWRLHIAVRWSYGLMTDQQDMQYARLSIADFVTAARQARDATSGQKIYTRFRAMAGQLLVPAREVDAAVHQRLAARLL